MFWIGFALTGFAMILNFFIDEKYSWKKKEKKNAKQKNVTNNYNVEITETERSLK